MQVAAQKNDQGFTLVEMLVALTIFALLAAASTTVLSVTLSAKDAVAQKERELSTLQVARAILKSDFAQMTARTVRDPFGGQTGQAVEGGFAIRDDTEVLIRFTRRGWINPGGRAPRGDVQYVEYRFTDGDLIRRSRLRTDPGPETDTVDRILFSGLSRADIRFHNGIAWQDDWTSGDIAQQDLPRAVELSLTGPEGERVPHLFVIKGAAP